jgi:hypothetical protein
MATADDDSMMNATRVGDLPQPAFASADTSGQGGAYSELANRLDIQKSKTETPGRMYQQIPQQMSQQIPQQLSQTTQQIPPQMFQNPMQSLHDQSMMYASSNGMPQSAPTQFVQPPPQNIISPGPVVNSLLPDPMYFNPPPSPKRRRPKTVAEPVAHKSLPKFDLEKLKPSILVAAIVFALLSWGAPVVAKRLTWTVDPITGKFTTSGLVVISILTGGIFLGITEIIRKLGGS